jgi:diacylglycerol kinase (ATP)
MTRTFTLSARIKSIKYAIKGIVLMLKTEPNAWIHALATLLVVTLGVFFRLTGTEWLLLVLSISAVWVAESFNTALEYLAGAITEDFHPLIKKAKDVSAGAVLISAVGSAIVGFIIFAPKLYSLN